MSLHLQEGIEYCMPVTGVNQLKAFMERGEYFFMQVGQSSGEVCEFCKKKIAEEGGVKINSLSFCDNGCSERYYASL